MATQRVSCGVWPSHSSHMTLLLRHVTRQSVPGLLIERLGLLPCTCMYLSLPPLSPFLLPDVS